MDARDEPQGLAARPLAWGRSRLFGQHAEAYDRFRPAYPDAGIDELLGPVPAGLDVLDVGCGTGIAAFEGWDSAGRTFDRVTSAQAWQEVYAPSARLSTITAARSS